MKTILCVGLALTALTAPFLLTLYAHGPARAAAKGKFLVYVGCGGAKQTAGIYAYRFDSASNQFTALGRAAVADNPSFLAVGPTRGLLYAVNETSDFGGRSSGALSAFSIAPATGQLTLLNDVSSGGAGPCHLAVDKTGKYVAVANYEGGSLATFPILPDGRLGPASAFVQHKGASINPQRQEGPHVHSVYFSPDNRLAVSADLGLDEVFVYRFDASKGTLSPNNPAFAMTAAGAGPRHFVFHPNGKFGYVVNEINSTVTAFAYDAHTGALDIIQTVSSLPEDFKGDSAAAEIAIEPTGKFLYASNRGHDSIAVFAINSKKGALTSVGFVPTLGKTPRNFAIDPTGAYLFAANSGSDNVVEFRIDHSNGLLTPTGRVLEAPAPLCVVFEPTD
jgi:6-phosphogluconolactonase